MSAKKIKLDFFLISFRDKIIMLKYEIFRVKIKEIISSYVNIYKKL